MPLKVFTIPAHDDGAAADAVNQFANTVRVVTVEKRFVEDGQNSFWAICVTYLASAAIRPTLPRREKTNARRRAASFSSLPLVGWRARRAHDHRRRSRQGGAW
jgi:hypothetical protein